MLKEKLTNYTRHRANARKPLLSKSFLAFALVYALVEQFEENTIYAILLSAEHCMLRFLAFSKKHISSILTFVEKGHIL